MMTIRPNAVQMNSIKERLQKMKIDAQQRSRNLVQSTTELDSGGTSTSSLTTTATIHLSSDTFPPEGVAKSAAKVMGDEENKKALRSWNSVPEMTVHSMILTSLNNQKSERNQLIREQPSLPTLSQQVDCAKAKVAKMDEPKARDMRRAISSSNARPQMLQSTNKTTEFTINGKPYTILRELGRGGSSKVYQAFSTFHKRVVAIKYINLKNADESVRESYKNEIKLLAHLQSSPFVIRMFDHERRNDKLFVVMECGDIDLATFMQKKSAQIDNKFIKYHWQEMLRCVQVIHNQNIVHSDLKPANFLFVGASLKLIDFGIASNIPSNKTSVMKDFQVGTLNYMSPEAISGSYTDVNGTTIYKIPLKSDVWSLGCILYAMVYGKTPFQHITNQVAKINAIVSEQHTIEYPDFHRFKDRLLMDVLKKCLVRDVRKRASIEDLLRHPYLRDTVLASPPAHQANGSPPPGTQLSDSGGKMTP